MPAVIAGREQLDGDDSPLMRPNDFFIWGPEISSESVSAAYVDQTVVQADNADTSGCLGSLGLFFDPPVGRLRYRPGSRRFTHRRSPISDEPACAANFATR